MVRVVQSVWANVRIERVMMTAELCCEMLAYYEEITPYF